MPALTGSERIFKTIHHEEPDMVPTFEEYIDIKVMQAIKPGFDYAGICEYLGLDAIVCNDMKTLQWEVVDQTKGLRRSEWGNVSGFTGA